MLDLVIIGGGPAGLTAGLYAVRSGLSCVLLEKMFAGGQTATANFIENFPGFEKGVSGYDLSVAMEKQAKNAGLEIKAGACSAITLAGETKIVKLGGDDTIEARSVILAMGAKPRGTGATDEEKLRGKGVSWCATCDGFMARGKRVAVIGGGNTAAEDALYLSNICEHVTIVHRRDKLRADHSLVKRIMDDPKISVLWNNVVRKFNGDERVTGIDVEDTKTGGKQTLDVSAVFIAVGGHPDSELVAGQVKMDGGGYILAGEDTRTSVPKVYAAGDIRAKQLRQIVTAVADGAVAASMAMHDLRL